MRKQVGAFFSGSAITYALVVPGSIAMAQSIPAVSPSQPPTPAAVVPGTVDIIVTAQRRSERERDVPISLTVRTAAALENAGVDKIRDLHVVTPGLRIDRNGAAVQPSIRGITALDGNPGNDANVAIYVDGVYRANPVANNLDLPDIERIEVLKGPQGTLFGRNATGGAIRIQTRMPEFDYTGDVTVGYGSFDDKIAKAFLTGPVIKDIVAVSLAGYYEKSDGYLRDLTNGGKATGGLDSKLVRGKILVKPSDRLQILLTGQYMDRTDGSLAGQPYNGNTIARGQPGVIIPTKPWDIANNANPFVHVREWSVSGSADLDLGFATLSTISAYSNIKDDGPVEDDYTNIAITEFQTFQFQTTFSQEVNLKSNGNGPLKWVVGGFYYRDRSRYDPLSIVSPGFTFNIFGSQNTKAYAAFGELTYDITDRLQAIAGVRYSHEKRMLAGSFITGDFPNLAERSFKSTTPRFTLRYAVTPDTNIYASYSKGFKSGGFTASSLGTDGFAPEKVEAFEAGIKSAPDRSFSINAAAFYYNYNNQQVQAALTLPSGGTVGVTTNAAKSRIYGAEFDATLRPSREFNVVATASWLHARYRSFPNAFVQTPVLIGGVPCMCGNVGVVVDATGNQLVRAPDFTVSITPTFETQTTSGTIGVSGTLYFSDKFFFTPDNRVNQPSYVTLSARAWYKLPDTDLKISLWGKNLTNSVVYQGASILPDADGILFAPRRSYGVEARYAF